MSSAADLARTIEALLFLSPEPVPVPDLIEACEVGEVQIRNALDVLADELAPGKRGLIEESGRSRFGATIYATTDLFERLFGLSGLDQLPDVARFDPTPEDAAELRERLLKAGEQRSEN